MAIAIVILYSIDYKAIMIKNDAECVTALSSMCSMAMLAARLAMKDSDLPKDDMLGEIDAGATENLLQMAIVQARDAMEQAGEGAFAGSMTRWAPARQVAALLRSDVFAMNHHRGGLLNDLLDSAMTITRAGESMGALQRFNDLYRMAERVFLQARPMASDQRREEGGGTGRRP